MTQGSDQNRQFWYFKDNGTDQQRLTFYERPYSGNHFM